jgi:delta 1-pyrroline-5-carboxylate dehydrogenase
MLEKIVEIGKSMAPGDPLDPKTRLGAIVDQVQLNTVLGFIESGKKEGADVRLGGNRARQESGGFFVEPTVFSNVNPGMRIAREEIFGPVLSTITFKDVEEAVKIANDVSYGLTAAVWSRDITTAHRVAKRLRAGTVYVNCYDADDITVPFGGFKQSGQRPRQVAARDGQVHRAQDHLDRPVMKVTVAATQMACSWDREANIANAERLIREAAKQGANVILIQELFEAPYFCKDHLAKHFELALPIAENRPSSGSRKSRRNCRSCCRSRSSSARTTPISIRS